MIDQIIALLKRQGCERIDVNGSTITQQLIESEDQELSVSLGFKLKRAGDKLIVTSKCAFARKFTDEGIETIDWDEDQSLIKFKGGGK